MKKRKIPSMISKERFLAGHFFKMPYREDKILRYECLTINSEILAYRKINDVFTDYHVSISKIGIRHFTIVKFLYRKEHLEHIPYAKLQFVEPLTTDSNAND